MSPFPLMCWAALHNCFFPCHQVSSLPAALFYSEQIWISCKHLVCWYCQLQRKKYLCWLSSHALHVFGYLFAILMHHLLSLSPNWQSFPRYAQVPNEGFALWLVLLKYYKISVWNEEPGIWDYTCCYSKQFSIQLSPSPSVVGLHRAFFLFFPI